VNGAIQLFEQNRQLMLNSNRWYVFDKWLSMFPDNVLQRQPELMLAQAWVHYFQYKHALIPPILDSVESLLSDDPKEQSLYGEIYLFKGVYCFMRGDFLSLEYIERALERLPVTYPKASPNTRRLPIPGRASGQSRTRCPGVAGTAAAEQGDC